MLSEFLQEGLGCREPRVADEPGFGFFEQHQTHLQRNIRTKTVGTLASGCSLLASTARSSLSSCKSVAHGPWLAGH